MAEITTEQSQGWAGFISMLIALLGLFETAYPGKLPFIAHALKALPVIGQIVPLIVSILGMVYASASSAVPWLRKLIPWKKERVTIVTAPGSL